MIKNIEFNKGAFGDLDYVRLHSCIRPNKLSLDAFKSILVSGQTDAHYSAVDMKKLAATAREIVLEHGFIQESSAEKWRGKKSDIANQLRITATTLPSSSTATISSSAAPTTVASSAEAGRVLRFPTGLLSSFTTDCYFPNALNESAARQFVSNQSGEAGAAASAGTTSSFASPTTTIPKPTMTIGSAGSTSMPLPCPFSDPSCGRLLASLSGAFSEKHNSSLQSDNVNASTSKTTASSSTTGVSRSGEPNNKTNSSTHNNNSIISNASPSFEYTVPSAVPQSNYAMQFWSVVASLCDGVPCAKGYQPYCSPLLPIVSELKRVTVRAGCGHSNFDVPSEHMNAVLERKRRVLAIPLQGGYQPAVWPKDAKDLYMYVNGSHHSQRWRRQWSRTDPYPSYLPVDITQFIDRRRQVQSVQFTCANFPLTVAVVVAYQLSEIDLAEALAKTFVRARDLAIAYRRMSNEEEKAKKMQRAEGEDEDDEVLEASADTMRTICPISRGRLSVPVRGAECLHIQPIDLAPFLRIAHTSCFWSCPKCNAPMRGENLVIDVPLMKKLRDLSIPRTWQGLELRRLSSIPFEKAPAGSLIDVKCYEWVRCTKEQDEALGVDSSDSEEEKEAHAKSSLAGGGGMLEGGGSAGSLSQRSNGGLRSQSSFSAPLGGSSRSAAPKAREVFTLDD